MSKKLILFSISVSAVNFIRPSRNMCLVNATCSGGAVVRMSSTNFFRKVGLKFNVGNLLSNKSVSRISDSVPASDNPIPSPNFCL